MSDPDLQPVLDEKRVYAMLQELLARVSRLEAHTGLPPLHTDASPVASAMIAPPALQEEERGIELQLGEYGLAWVGSAILFLGIAFLMTYTQSQGFRVLATGIGYLAAIGLYGCARFWRRHHPHLSQVVISSSLLLLYYTTMRLGFFSPAPLIPNAYLALLLLLIVVALHFGVALRRHSQPLAAIALLLATTSALLIDRTHLSLSLVALTAAAAAYLEIRRNWRHLLPLAIFLAYVAHGLWLIGNPLVGHELGAAAEPQYNPIYLFLYAAIFFWPALRQRGSPADDAQTIIAVLLNCGGFSMLMALAVLTHFQHPYAVIYLGVALFFLLVSITQWLTAHQPFTPAITACFGYLALSIALYGYAGIPMAFWWLAWQSLLVVLMALWFRSRTLVVMNALIFATILLAYFISSPSANRVNFSFAIAALASARVMNWQKERLTLRTELLRNVYLGVAFVLVFYALYRAVPGQYITLSWTATAVIYFLLSYVLGSLKYRWMAIAAMLVTVIYLFLVDLRYLNPVFRVAAFLFLGFMALGISLFYNRVRSRPQTGAPQSNAQGTHGAAK